MNLFFSVSDKEMVRLRHEVFEERGIPALTQSGFSRSPFSTGWFGKNNAGGYSYEFCRVADESRLDMILVYINKGDRWVQLHLNVFDCIPRLTALNNSRVWMGCNTTCRQIAAPLREFQVLAELFLQDLRSTKLASFFHERD